MDWTSPINDISEPRRITLVKDVWLDPARDRIHGGRQVPYKIYLPESYHPGEKFPVILWSHGLGGSRDGAGFISRFVAAQGYVIVHIQHIGTDTILWDGMPGHPWDNIRKARIPRKHVLLRYGDIPFTLRQLDALSENPDNPTGRAIDLSRLGMSGHSFGALTTQIMAGQRVARGDRAYSLFQNRFQAGILYSPVPGRQDPKDPRVTWGGIRIPLLHMTGTDDESPIEGFGIDRRLKVYEHAQNSDQHLIVLKNGDHMVFNGSRGQLANNPARTRHEEIIKVLSLAWWDARLKNRTDAQHWWHGDGLRQFLNNDATYESKAP